MIEAQWRGLFSAFVELGYDERAVLLLVARRLKRGREQYGQLDVAADARNWKREAGEEMADALVYLACSALAAEAKGER